METHEKHMLNDVWIEAYMLSPKRIRAIRYVMLKTFEKKLDFR